MSFLLLFPLVCFCFLLACLRARHARGPSVTAFCSSCLSGLVSPVLARVLARVLALFAPFLAALVVFCVLLCVFSGLLFRLLNSSDFVCVFFLSFCRGCMTSALLLGRSLFFSCSNRSFYRLFLVPCIAF